LVETKEVTMSQLILKPVLTMEVLDNLPTMVTTNSQPLMHGAVDPNSPTPMPELANGGKSK
jgi:hypothetical protein